LLTRGEFGYNPAGPHIRLPYEQVESVAM
jgi:hypothetical protein